MREETFGDNAPAGPVPGHFARASVRDAFAIYQPVVIQTPGTIVEKDLPADVAVIQHKQNRAGIDLIVAKHDPR